MRPLAILMVLTASALQGELLPIRTYTTADGLAAERVDRIVADSGGFLWFCTQEGLSRFDGNRFVSYGVDEGLPHSSVSTLIETSSGEHWVGTARGFGRIATNGTGPRFTNYQLGPDAGVSQIRALLESRSGKLLAATRGGLFEWTALAGPRRTEFPAPPEVINELTEDTSGNLWIGTTLGLYLYGEGRVIQKFTVSDGLPGEWVEVLLWDSQGKLWVALRGGLALMSRNAAGTWGVEKAYTEKSGLVGWDVKALVKASDGTFGLVRCRESVC